MENIAIIIVAAGASSRMQESKQLLPFGKTTILGQVIANAKGSNAAEVITVLGANYEKIKSQIEVEEITIVQNHNWEEGLGSSIATGINYVLKSKNCAAVIILLADQPLIDTGYINLLLKTHLLNPAKIIATKYPKSLGVPVIFPERYFNELAQLKDDEGAKTMLQREKEVIITLNAANKTFDVDSRQDYDEILKLRGEL